MKHWFVFLLSFLSVCFVQAQDISVVKFQKLENDLDARVNAPVLDQNGQKCALLKVVTIEKGFTFDVGQLGVVKTLYKPAEVWVYVPKGVNKIKITHPQLGQIKSDDGYYWFPSGGVEEAVCYRLEITTARVTTTIEEPKESLGYLIFTSEPAEARVYITVNGEERDCGKTPTNGELLPYGTYRYRVSKNMYHQASGEISVKNGQEKEHITLQPAFGYLEVKTQPSGAQIIIEGQDKEYTTPYKVQLSSGKYKVRLTKKLYGTSEYEVTVRDNQTTPLNATLNPKFAHLVVNTLAGASVYIDKKFMGKGPKYEVDLLEGWHDIEAQLASHRTVRKQLDIIAKRNQEISLNPTPIWGTLNIKPGSTNDATIFIDNKDYGKAPQVIDKILVGKHTVKLEKAGYEPVVKEIEIKEGEMFSFEEKMENKHIPLTVWPSSNVEFPAKGGVKTLYIAPRDGWKLEEDVKTSLSWLTIERGDEYIRVQAKKNKTDLSRFGSFLISTTTERKRIFIDQQGVTSKIKSSRIKQEWEKFFYGELSCQVDFCKPLLWGIGASIGTYGEKHINFEAFGSYSGHSSIVNAHVGVKTGYGLELGSKGDLTPQIGLGWRLFDKIDDPDAYERGLSDALTLDISIRLSLGGKFRFILVPEYSLAFLASKGYSTIVPQMSSMKAWRNGFGLRCGLAITW